MPLLILGAVGLFLFFKEKEFNLKDQKQYSSIQVTDIGLQILTAHRVNSKSQQQTQSKCQTQMLLG